MASLIWRAWSKKQYQKWQKDEPELIGHTGDTMGYLSFAFAIPEYQATLIGHINADRDDAFFTLLQETAAAVRAACAPDEGE